MTGNRQLGTLRPLALVLLALLAELAALCAPLAAFRGKVVDAQERPVAGAVVSVLGRSGSAITGADGLFEWRPDPTPPFELLVILRNGTYTQPVLVARLEAGDADAEPLLVTVQPALSEGLVVSGTTPGVESTPAAGTTSLSAREIAARQPSNLIQALENVAGVSQVSEGQAAVPALRGLSGGRTLILIDGARVTARQPVGVRAHSLRRSGEDEVQGGHRGLRPFPGRGGSLPWGRCARPSIDLVARSRHRSTVWWKGATSKSRATWEERFEATYARWRGFVDDLVFAFTECGDLNRGFARVYCDACRDEYLLAFSCSRRGFCPSCAAKRGAIFGAFLLEEVLEDVSHCMWTLTIPKLLRPYFLNHRELLGPLSRAGWETVAELISEAGGRGVRLGMVATMHTATSDLLWSPHVHAIASRGGWDSDGVWHPVLYVDEKAAELLFRQKVICLVVGRRSDHTRTPRGM